MVEHSPLTGIAPHVKLVAVFFFVVSVAVTPRQAVWAFLVDGVVLLAGFGVARVGLSAIWKRLAILGPVIISAVVLPFLVGGETVPVAGFSLSVDGLWGAWNLLAKAGLGFGASVLLLSTTSVAGVISALSVLRLPPLLVAIVASMLRYLDVIVEEVGRTRQAMAARGYNPKWFWEVKPLALASGSLFVRSFERAERVHTAMVARGFSGTMPTSSSAAGWRSWAVVIWGPVCAACAAGSALIV